MSVNCRIFQIKILILIRGSIRKCNKELQHVSKELSLFKSFLFKQLSTTDFYLINKSITSHNKKSLQKSLNTQQKKMSSLTRSCSLLIFTAKETITNLTQYELSQEDSDLFKADLYFSIQPDKIRKSEIFTTFEKIHLSFIKKLKPEETNKSADKSASLVSCYFLFLQLQTFFTYTTLSSRLTKHQDIVITKLDKENGDVILDRKL